MNDTTALLSDYENEYEINIDELKQSADETAIPADHAQLSKPGKLNNTVMLAHIDEIASIVESKEWLINKMFIEGTFRSCNTMYDHWHELHITKKELSKTDKKMSDKLNSTNKKLINSTMLKINLLLDKLLIFQKDIETEEIRKLTRQFNELQSMVYVYASLMIILLLIILFIAILFGFITFSIS